MAFLFCNLCGVLEEFNGDIMICIGKVKETLCALWILIPHYVPRDPKGGSVAIGLFSFTIAAFRGPLAGHCGGRFLRWTSLLLADPARKASAWGSLGDFAALTFILAMINKVSVRGGTMREGTTREGRKKKQQIRKGKSEHQSELRVEISKNKQYKKERQ
jgi:hypothetical protein